MRVLVACEYSGRVRNAFRALGHDAWSCDLLEAEDGSTFHIQGDCLEAIKRGWDLMVAHPPCTDLAVSGARHFEEKRKDGRQQKAIEFFMALSRAPIHRIAIENPVCIMSGLWREPDQVIQPWMFGHGETKATCLWLKGLPPSYQLGSFQDENPAFTACRPVQAAGKSEAAPMRVLRMQWLNSGAITRIWLRKWGQHDRHIKRSLAQGMRGNPRLGCSDSPHASCIAASRV